MCVCVCVYGLFGVPGNEQTLYWTTFPHCTNQTNRENETDRKAARKIRAAGEFAPSLSTVAARPLCRLFLVLLLSIHPSIHPSISFQQNPPLPVTHTQISLSLSLSLSFPVSLLLFLFLLP